MFSGKLNPTQLEAARRRAVPISATTLAPTVDGFRQSSKKAAISDNKAKSEVKKAGKVSEELLYCPSRKRTNPSRITNPAETKPDPPVKIEAAAANIQADKVKSKEFISTEEDTEDDTDVKLKIASEENVSPTAPEVEKKEVIKVENIRETLDGDLTVSDSDDDEKADVKKPVSTKMSHPSDEFFESDDEQDRKGRFSKLKSERQEDEITVPAPPEPKPPVTDVKAQVPNRALPEKPMVFHTLLEEAVHGFKVRSKSKYDTSVYPFCH